MQLPNTDHDLFPGVSLLSDGKDSNDHIHLLNFLVSTPQGICFLKTVDCSENERSAQNIANLMTSTINSLPPKIKDNLVVLVTDGPNVNRACGELLEAQFPRLSWISCLVHGLNLLFKDALEFPEPKQLYSEVKQIVHTFYGRSRPRRLLREKLAAEGIKLKGVIRVCELRFGNCYIVMQRLLDCYSALKAVVVSKEFEKWTAGLSSKESDTVRGLDEMILKKDFWLNIKDFLEVMKPVYEFLREVDTNKLMMGKIYFRMSEINTHFTKVSSNLYKGHDLPAMFVARWDKSIHSPFHSAGKNLVLDYFRSLA